MKIKTKLRLGFGFLFVVVLFFGAISLFYLNEIAGSAKVILKDNYKTLNYTGAMRTLLDEHDLPLQENIVVAFKRELALEEKNITEKGERKAVQHLYRTFNALENPASKLATQSLAVREIRAELRNIENLNMNAIVRKNDKAQAAVKKATLYLVFTASLSILVLFTFIVNFPGFVADPLQEFSAAIRAISRRNYKQRLEFNNNDEFTELAAAFNGMTVLLNQWENSNLAEIKSEKLRIEAIIEQMDDAIIGLNDKKEVLFFNKVAGELLSLNQQQIVGQNAETLMQNNELLKRILESKNNQSNLKIFADNKESYFKLESREIIVPNFEEQCQQVLVASSASAGKVYILRNITEFKELDEAKTNFIATVSHELKTPLSSIKMSLKLLSDSRVGNLNKEQTALVEHIREDSDRLLKITSELLDLAQVETGNLQLNFVKSPPRQIIDYAISAVKFQAEQKSIQLELISKSNVGMVYADVEKTAWVLVNFLSNALRYSAEKSTVIIQVTEINGQVEFSVRDFGKGIEEQYQKRLFDRYFQVPTDGDNKSGSGLGLAISRDFIEAEQGRIWVESELGAGSRFCFSLPVAV